MNVRPAPFTILLFTSALFLGTPARATGCRGILGRWFQRDTPAPVIARGFEVGPLAGARWTNSGADSLTSFASPWGESVVKFNGTYLTISVRPIAGTFRFTDGILRTLHARVGPVEHREGVAVTPEDPGEMKPKGGWYSIYLGQAQTGPEEYEARARKLLNVFYGALPYELRQIPKTSEVPIDIIPLAVRDDRWRLVDDGWMQDLKTAWGQTRVTIGKTTLRFIISPADGDLIFSDRDLQALKTRVPGVRYELDHIFHPGLDTIWPNDEGRFKLTFQQADDEYDVTAVDALLNAVLTIQPKKARSEMLTGRRPLDVFDRSNRASTHPIAGG